MADSAAVAREHYRQSLIHDRAGNTQAALASARRAASAWPTQPAYLGRVASLAAKSGDADLAARSLQRLAELGARYPVAQDPAFAAIDTASVVLRAVGQMDSLTRPMPESLVAATFGPADFFAEGVAVGPDGTLYIGSVGHRLVLARDTAGRVVELLDSSDSLWAVSGLVVSPDGRSLWLASNAIPQMQGYDSSLAGRAELVQVALETGRIVCRVPVGGNRGGAMLGDLVVTPDGAVHASDTRGQVIWSLAPDTSVPKLLTVHPLVRSPQGMVPTLDGTGLLVADYSHGLLRVDRSSGAVTSLEGPGGMTLLGIDGLARHGRDLVAIQNGGVVPRVVRIWLDAAETRVVALDVLDRNTAVADEPTLGVVVGNDFLYVANSQWEKRGPDGTVLPGATLSPTTILRLPLRPPVRR